MCWKAFFELPSTSFYCRFEMVRWAARLFIEHIHAEDKPEVESIVMKPQLMVRASSLRKEGQ